MFDSADLSEPGEARGVAIEWHGVIRWRPSCLRRRCGCGLFARARRAGAAPRYSYLCIDPCEVLRGRLVGSPGFGACARQGAWPEAPVPFAGGAACFFGYDAVAAAESGVCAPGEITGVPGMQFGIFDMLFAWDHAAQRCWLLHTRAPVMRASRRRCGG